MRFRGYPRLAMFEFDPDPAPTAEQAFKDAEAARRGGYRIAQKELEDASGYSLIPDGDSGGGTGVFPGNTSVQTVQNSATLPNPVAIQCLGGQVAPDGAGAGVDTPKGTDAAGAAVEGFLGDAEKWRGMARRLMDSPTPETAKEILAELESQPSALAKAMEEWMAENYVEAFEDTENDGVVQNKGVKCPDCGQWTGADGSCTNCSGTEGTGENPDSSEKQAAEIGKGKAALKKCLEGKTDIYDAVHRGDIGNISFVYGDDKGGIAHFSGRKEALAHLPETLVRGTAGEPYEKGRKINIFHGGYQATIRTDRNGRDERWVLTAFGPGNKKGEA